MNVARRGFFLLMVVVVAGCGKTQRTAAPADSTTTVTDALGREVTFARPVRRVVSMAPNLTEIVFAAGAGEKLAGVTTAADYPPAVDTLARFSALPVDFDAIAALRPDLVLATDQVNAPRQASTFEALGIPLYFFSFSSMEGVLESIRTTGRLLGTPAAADAAADSLRYAIQQLEAKTAAVEQRPLVLFLIGDNTLYAFGSGSYIHTLIRLAGGRSATANLDAKAPILTEEFVLTTQPDVIIGAWGAHYPDGRLLELHPTWDVVPAIKNGRVYSLPPDLVLRPGPRLVKSARQMARLLHPELFGG